MNQRKLLQKALAGSANIRFRDFCSLIEAFGFRLDRINGSHHIFVNPKVQELINVQNVKGKVKPYQVRQFLSIIEKYNLQLHGDKK